MIIFWLESYAEAVTQTHQKWQANQLHTVGLVFDLFFICNDHLTNVGDGSSLALIRKNLG